MAGDKSQVVSIRRTDRFPQWAMMWIKVAMVVVIVTSVSIAGCGMQINHAPVINSLVASPSTVATGGSTTITCNATDADGDTLTYTWSSTAGTVTGAGASVTWMAPSVDGTYTVTVTVADGKGGTATDSVDISVIVGNNPPVIASVVAASASVPPGGTTTVTCTATDADGDTLTYTWSAPNGGAITGSGSTITWQAPAAEDTYTVAVTVSDGQGGTASGSTNIVVVFVATSGSLNIQSNPAGARVYIDGVDTGNITPYIRSGLSSGAHNVRLTYPHYKDEVHTVTVPAGGTEYVNWALTYAPTLTTTLQPDATDGKDSYVYQGTPNDNRGTDDHVCAAGGVGTACRVFIQFDLSSLPSTAVVTSARLDLFYHNNAGGALQGPVGAYRVTQSWDEGTITWNNQPTVAATVTDTRTVPAVATNSFRNWYITDLVQGWIDGSIANYGTMLADTDESTAEKYKCFRSSDWGTAVERPKLIIQYYDPVP